MNTADIVASTGYSAQQIRDLESLGVIPDALRRSNGYRQFSDLHVRDLHAYRDLASAVGPVDARRAMREIRSLPPGQAASLVCSFHTRINSEREQALMAHTALEAIRAEATTDAKPVEADSMTITELSQALGVKTSALRFWEKVGLVAPERTATRAGAARRYHLAAIREARITTALRAGGYRIPDVQAAITAIRELHDVSHSLNALDERLGAIAQRSIALLRAGATLSQIIELAREREDRTDLPVQPAS